MFLTMADKLRWTADVGHRVMVLLTLAFLYFHIPGSHGQCKVEGTTPGLNEILVGRCTDYQKTINPAQFCNNGVSEKKNCTELMELFVNSFAYRRDCNTTFSRYDSFIRAANTDPPADKSLFWSGVRDTAQRYSDGGQRFVTLENTLIGYMVNELQFCGQETSPGLIFNKSCGEFYPTANCSNPAMFSFFAMASKNFASRVSGVATVMLNGSRDEPFRNNSFFATWEVPNLNPEKVTKMQILLLHFPGQEVRSTCHSDNIGELVRRLDQKNIDHVCEENPRGPLALMCVDYPGEKECQMGTTTSSANTMSLGIISLTFLIVDEYIVNL